MDNKIYSFFVDIEKYHLTLCKLVEKDDLRPCMWYILLDTQNECMVSSNGRVLKEIPVKIETDGELPNHLHIYLDPKSLKNLIGKNRVDVIECEEGYTTSITNISSGMRYANDFNYRYPKYRAVYPKLRNDGYIRFKQGDIKNIVDFCKKAKKESLLGIVTLSIDKGGKSVLLFYENYVDLSYNEIRVDLEYTANMTIRIGISGEYLYNLSKDWNGGMWLVAPSIPVVLDYKYNAIGLMVQKDIDSAISPDECKCDINPLRRIEALQSIEAAHPAKAVRRSKVSRRVKAAQPETVETSQPIEAAQPETVETAQPIETVPTYEAGKESQHIEAAQPETVETAQPIETVPTYEAGKESQHIEAAQPETVETAQPIETVPTYEAGKESQPIEGTQPETVETEQPIEAVPTYEAGKESQHIEAAQPETTETAQPIEAAPAYEVWEKSQPGIFALPWQIRLLLSILYNFKLIKSPLRYAIAQQLEAYMEALLPTAVPTETLLQAIRPAFGTQFGSPFPTLCGFSGIKTHKNGLENLGKIGTFGGCVDPHAALIGCVGVAMVGSRGGVAMVGSRGGVEMAGSRGGVAMVGSRGGVVASMRCGEATAGMRSGVSLIPSYALWPFSPITRSTGAGPPG